MDNYMTAQEALKAAEGITFEKAWAILQEERRAAEEERRAAEKKREEEQRKADKKREKEMAEFKRNLDKTIGKLGNSVGALTEELFSGEIYKKFKKIGYEFDRQSSRYKITDGNDILTEVDCWLENGEFVMAVEVKTDLNERDVDYHLARIKKIRQYQNKKGDKRKIVGAVAGGIVKKEVIRHAHKNGLYVIKQSGESAIIVESPKDFEPQVW